MTLDATLILLYHRIATYDSDPQLLCVTPAHFNEHLQILCDLGAIIPLSNLASQLQAGAAPDRAIVLTFDDGYADNLHNAKPILDRHHAPATVFVTTGQTNTNEEFWWDALDRLLLRPGPLAPTLTLTLNHETRDFTLAPAPPFTKSDWQSNLHWTVENPADPNPRYRLYRDLCDYLHPLPAIDRAAALEQVQAWTNAAPPPRPTHRAMTSAEISQLTSSGLIEVGAHTVSHPLLSSQPVDVQQDEIESSKSALEKIHLHDENFPSTLRILHGLEARVTGDTPRDTGFQPVQSARQNRITTFSYPFGYRAAYTPDTIRLVQSAGFTCACSNFPGLVYPDTDLYQLPRFLVRDWPGDEFSRRLQTFLTRRSRARDPVLTT